MVSAESKRSTAALPARLIAGAVGGLIGGIPLGIIMHSREIMPMVADLIGSQSVGVGWLVHLFNSALFGAVFALLMFRWITTPISAMAAGIVYGIFWWIVGALLIMPAWLGMNEMIFEINENAWWSLAGHLVFGILLGAIYALLLPRLERG
jgi:hypothetical protein